MRDETLDDYLERNNLFLCRQLTDEEITEIYSHCFDGFYKEMTFDFIHFAKEILKKAKEK